MPSPPAARDCWPVNLKRPTRALERRWREIGGMIELARVLDAWRLVRPLETHKDALRRQMESL